VGLVTAAAVGEGVGAAASSDPPALAELAGGTADSPPQAVVAVIAKIADDTRAADLRFRTNNPRKINILKYILRLLNKIFYLMSVNIFIELLTKRNFQPFNRIDRKGGTPAMGKRLAVLSYRRAAWRI
jgi:hypothetical protein